MTAYFNIFRSRKRILMLKKLFLNQWVAGAGWGMTVAKKATVIRGAACGA
jgi:hypothetical protein